jgi:hypothetical protein
MTGISTLCVIIWSCKPLLSWLQAMRSDDELYSWMDDLYNRSPLLGVSNPTNFVHQVHVGFDSVSGAFTGLPEQWTRLLTSSAITKEDYAKNPQAVLDVLEFYTESQRRERDAFEGRDQAAYIQVVPQSEPTAVAPSSRFAAGTGFAGQSLSSNTAGKDVTRSPRTDGGAPSESISSSLRSQKDAAVSSPYRTQASAATANTLSARPDLVPQRRAPAAPTAGSVKAQTDYTPPDLKPLVLSATAPQVRGKGLDSTAGTSKPSKGPALAVSAHPVEVRSGGTTTDARAEQKPPAPKPAPATLKPTAAQGTERRISKLTDREIQEKLRQVTSPEDPTRIYTKLKKVGQGASGSVYVARINATGEKVAIKQMDLAQQPRKELIVNEILVMKESRHDNIVNFRDSFLVKDTELWVVMDFMESGALTDVIDNHTLEEDQISTICREVSLFERL